MVRSTHTPRLSPHEKTERARLALGLAERLVALALSGPAAERGDPTAFLFRLHVNAVRYVAHVLMRVEIAAIARAQTVSRQAVQNSLAQIEALRASPPIDEGLERIAASLPVDP